MGLAMYGEAGNLEIPLASDSINQIMTGRKWTLLLMQLMFLVLMIRRSNCSDDDDKFFKEITQMRTQPPPGVVQVDVSYYYRYLVKMDAVNQVVTLNGLIGVQWNDDRLKWYGTDEYNASDYKGRIKNQMFVNRGSFFYIFSSMIARSRGD